MNLLDSSAWITFIEEGPQAAPLEKYFQKSEGLLVPTIVIHEVYRQLLKKLDRQEAIFYIAQMEEGRVIPLDQEIALSAAEIRLKYKLSTADAIVYATALDNHAKLVTLDNDFRDLPGCLVIN